MAYWMEKENGSNITTVQCVFDDVFIPIGTIEKPYSFDSIYTATGRNYETLKNGDSYLFKSFEDAYNSIIEAYEGSLQNA